MCRKLIYLVSFAMLLSAASSVQALVEITTADGNGADTYLSNDNQSGNYGPNSVHSTEDTLTIRRYDGTRQKIGYIRFDLTGITGDVNNATLSLNLTSSKTERVWRIYGLVYETGDNWPEAMTSYSSAPGFDPCDLGYYRIDANELQSLGTISIPAGDGYCTSSTSDLKLDSFIGRDTNKRLTFALIPDVSTVDDTKWAVTPKESNATLAPKLTLPNALRPPASSPKSGK